MFVYDMFKYLEVWGMFCDWFKYYGMIVWCYMEQFMVDISIFDILELYDEVFYVWWCIFVYQLL